MLRALIVYSKDSEWRRSLKCQAACKAWASAQLLEAQVLQLGSPPHA